MHVYLFAGDGAPVRALPNRPFALALTLSFYTQSMQADAMVLAAGRGERLRPFTDHIPKPLLEVGGKSLLERHLRALSRSGIEAVVVNTAWLADQFEATFGDGSSCGIRIIWSHEQAVFGHALGTAGGVANALQHLADVFWVVSADVLIPEFEFDAQALSSFKRSDDLAQLWLVENPPHNRGGDFSVDAHGRIVPGGAGSRTWGSVGLFRRTLFSELVVGDEIPLRPVLDRALRLGKLGARALDGRWLDVGTPERLRVARSWFAAEE